MPSVQRWTEVAQPPLHGLAIDAKDARRLPVRDLGDEATENLRIDAGFLLTVVKAKTLAGEAAEAVAAMKALNAAPIDGALVTSVTVGAKSDASRMRGAGGVGTEGRCECSHGTPQQGVACRLATPLTPHGPSSYPDSPRLPPGEGASIIRRMLHAVVMAGGSGTRFWPESRRNRPKQLLPITGGQAMLAETIARLDPLVPLERTWVVTNAQQVQGVRRVCPRLPVQNILVEPVGRNTAPCVGLAAAVIAEADRDAVMVVLPADHVISPVDEFQRALRAAVMAADQPGRFVTFGIPPTWPAIGYGYIRRAARTAVYEGLDCFHVAGFTEKPQAPRAQQFIDSGEYLWNSGIFVWRARTILDAIQQHMPELHLGLARIAEKIGESGFQAELDRVYPGLPAVPVDVGIMEKVEGALVLSAPFRWSDVGSWKSLYDEVKHDEHGNAAIFPKGGTLLAEDARGILAYSSEPQILAVLGVDDLVVVRTADAVLVARRDRAEDVKLLVDRLKAAGREDAT